MKPLGKFIGIDHGLKRIGIAVSDPMGISARELCIIRRRSKTEDFETINRIAQDENAIAFIVGLPNNDPHDGHRSQAKSVRNWTKRFMEATSLPVLFWDEQLTSADARALARSMRRHPQKPVDDLAARLILQSYLDAVHDGLASAPMQQPGS